MLQEIAEQPEALGAHDPRRTCKDRQDWEISCRGRELDLIVLVARGSSDNAALFGRYLLEITTGIPVCFPLLQSHHLRRQTNLKHALVIGVSQSGEGEDINQVLENARACGAFTVGITNEPSSSMVNFVMKRC